MNSRRLLLPLVLCLPFVAGGCALVQAFLGGQKPELTFRDMRLTGWSLDKVDLELVYELHNPYDVPLKLKEVAYQLEVEGRRLLSGAPKEGVSVKAKSRQLLRFPATVHFLDVIPVATKLFTKETLGYRASGRIGVDTPLGVVGLPLSHSGDIGVPKLPRVEITDISAPRIGSSGVQLSLGLKIHNANDFPVQLDALAWNFRVDRASLASGSTQAASLSKGGSRTLRIPIDVKLADAGQAVQKLLSGKQSQVSLTGSLRAGKVDAPLDVSKLLELTNAR